MSDITIHVPSAAALKPPKPAAINTEAANFLRAHWGEAEVFYKVIAGEAPSTHGNTGLDEADATFKLKEIAASNGYAMLGNLETVRFQKALRAGFYAVTGERIGKLKAQGRRLLIEKRKDENA